MWRRDVVVITTAQLHSNKPELRFCAGSNPARGVSEIRDREDLWQWSRLEIRLNAFLRATISQKQFIIIIIIIIIIIKCAIIYPLEWNSFKLWQKLQFNVIFLVQFLVALPATQLYLNKTL